MYEGCKPRLTGFVAIFHQFYINDAKFFIRFQDYCKSNRGLFNCNFLSFDFRFISYFINFSLFLYFDVDRKSICECCLVKFDGYLRHGLGGCFHSCPAVFTVSVYSLCYIYAIVIELSRSVATQIVFTSITKEFVIVESRKLSLSSKDVF